MSGADEKEGDDDGDDDDDDDNDDGQGNDGGGHGDEDGEEWRVRFGEILSVRWWQGVVEEREGGMEEEMDVSEGRVGRMEDGREEMGVRGGWGRRDGGWRGCDVGLEG